MEKKKILIVDDEFGFVEMLKIRFEANNYDVITANDGEEAIHMLGERPDAIILDVMMPNIDGYTFLKEMKANPETKDIPVIVVTAKPDMKDLFQMEGISNYVTKPIDSDEILKILKSLL